MPPLRWQLFAGTLKLFLWFWLKTPFVSTKFCDFYAEMVQGWQILMFYATIVHIANDCGYKILCFRANLQKYQTLIPAKNSHLNWTTLTTCSSTEETAALEGPATQIEAMEINRSTWQSAQTLHMYSNTRVAHNIISDCVLARLCYVITSTSVQLCL